MLPKPTVGPGLVLLLLACCVVFLVGVNPCLFTYVLWAALGLAFLFLVFVIGYVVYWLIRNHLSPVTRIRSRVIRRRKKGWDLSLIGDTPESATARLGMVGRNHTDAWKGYSHAMARGDVPELDLAFGTNYFVTFDVEGRQQEFCVPEVDYIKCAEGAEGLLIFRREQFKRFMPLATPDVKPQTQNPRSQI